MLSHPAAISDNHGEIFDETSSPTTVRTPERSHVSRSHVRDPYEFFGHVVAAVRDVFV